MGIGTKDLKERMFEAVRINIRTFFEARFDSTSRLFKGNAGTRGKTLMLCEKKPEGLRNPRVWYYWLLSLLRVVVGEIVRDITETGQCCIELHSIGQA
jgi:hypothetical protein